LFCYKFYYPLSSKFYNYFNNIYEYFINTIGNNVKRAFDKLFQDEYAIKCTWTGRGKEIVTKIGDSTIIKIVKSKSILHQLNIFSS